MKSRRIALTHSSLQSRVHSSRLSMLAWTQALTLGLLAASGSGRSLAAEPVSPTAVAVEVADNNQVEEIMITGTRITTGGYGSPNPVMAVGAERIQDMAVTDVAEALNKIPTFRPTLTPQTTADGTPTNIAGRIADLRGLGASRTLVLVDGRRFVPSNSQGTVDLNNIPTNLVERVDVVTGGASALYGADAVSGVVNLILDKHYNGLEVEGTFGRSQAGDMNRPYFSLKAGTAFAGGRGHLLIGGELLDDGGSGDCFSRRSCAQNINIISNPTPGNGQPYNMMLPDLYAVNSANGLIISGALAGTTFTPNGTPTKFNYGAMPGFVFMHGGDSDNGKQLWLEGALISQAVQRGNVMAHVDFDFTDRLQGYLEASYAQVNATANSIPPVEFPTTIQADNAFLPDSLKATLAGAGETSFQFKRQNNDFGVLVPESADRDQRYVAGLTGLIGEKWHWNAYYQYGRHTNDSQIGNNRINANWALAVDAVTAPNGQVVCRSTLTDPNNGCHPVDLFGSGVSSDSSKMYVNGTSYVTRVLEEQVGAVNFSGSPFQSWAGPVAMAFGLETRRDTANGTVDAISAAQGWWNNAGTPIDGAVSVTEGYIEADIPLAKSLTLNAADRETHYTTTGNANTWKVGLVWDMTDMFRLRATQSHDFRAPNMDELFGPTNSHPTILIDPVTNTQVFVTQHQGGNPNLQPETGDTTTFGVVFQGRSMMEGLKASLDYYQIKIKDAVDIVNPQTILDRCAAGDQLYCQYVTRDASGNVTDLTVTYLNLDKLDTSGLDLSADYTLPLSKFSSAATGTLTFGLVANYVYHLRLTDSGGHTVDRASQTGIELLGTPGMPRYNINLLTTYAQGPGSVSLQARYIASGVFDPELIGPDKSNYDPNLPNSINRNTVASAWYADLAAHYDIHRSGSNYVQLFGAINNLFDEQPPFLPSFHNAIFFDNVGRYYTVGARIKF